MDKYIGMWNNFDEDKYSNDYHLDFVGIEFCSLVSKDEIYKIKKFSKERNFKIGIHCPIDINSYKYRDPLVNHFEETEREEAFSMLEEELKLASELNAKYYLLHFPKPILLDEEVDFSIVPFNDYEVMKSSDISEEEFKSICEMTFKRLSVLGYKFNIKIILELEFLSKWIYKRNLLEDLLKRYENIRLCLDTSRMHVNSVLDKNFDLYTYTKRMSKYIDNLHVSNVQVKDKLLNRHNPALENLSEKDGWCDVKKIFKQLKKPDNILYEHNSKRISKSELTECYKWIKEDLEKR